MSDATRSAWWRVYLLNFFVAALAVLFRPVQMASKAKEIL